MFKGFSNITAPHDAMKLKAIDNSQAVIEFTPEGKILYANENFLSTVGYNLEEIRDHHHSMFVRPEDRDTEEYRQFWTDLKSGKFQQAEYLRIGKGGKKIWIQATYNPLKNEKGHVTGVIKFATDITQQKNSTIESDAQMAAIGKSMAVIHFNMDGTIIRANENFLGALGYQLSEIQGKHHRIFVDGEYAKSFEYKDFWERLNAGEFQAAQYKRFTKSGQEIWIEATYNPIVGDDGKPYKVVKFATDITRQINAVNNVISNVSEIESAMRSVHQQAGVATSGAGVSSENVSSVASAIEELNASTAEISSSMAHSGRAVSQAIEQTAQADEAVQKLDTAAVAMSGIVELIQNIAGQINLLSLNATIESARAGDAGKGFAVVAGEVKNLAKQAADATDRIAQEIGNVQSIAKNVVSSLSEIKSSVQSVESYVSSTASAVEEQSAVTLSISSSMQNAAMVARDISDSMMQVTAAVEQTTGMVDRTRSEASSLKK